MKINIIGIEPQFKVYKMSENIDNMYYIGKTKAPLIKRMNYHRHTKGETQLYCDIHFADVGFRNVTVDIIDVANNDEELDTKEKEHIKTHYETDKLHMLNRYGELRKKKSNKATN